MQTEKIKKYIFLSSKVFLCIIIYLFFCLYTPAVYKYSKIYAEKYILDKKVIIVGASVIDVKVVDSLEERIKGLSGRKELEEKEGMLFIFEYEDTHGIWMKDMNFDIDIIWFDKYGAIIDVEENVSPKTFPRVYKPDKDSKYILEVQGGFFQKKSFKNRRYY